MDLFTLNRDFFKQNIIDEFESFIWTERYYGDSEVELVIPAKSETVKKLPLGIFLGIDRSDEIMILETVNIEGENLKFYGVSLLSWLNNRFIRSSAVHADRAWFIENKYPGEMLWYILWSMTSPDSGYLNFGVDTGIPDPQRLAIPGIYEKNTDMSGEQVNIAVPFGPLYNALKEIAVAYGLGMQLTLDSVTEGSYLLGFRVILKKFNRSLHSKLWYMHLLQKFHQRMRFILVKPV
jgi:hypothetical protein